jgi:S1-C subfamily serine protease
MASGMQAIEALRKKHTPKVSCHSHYHSTVGLVVEGCEIGGVVPGGPCDKEFPGGLIQEQDTIMEVDGEAHTPDSLPDALRGKDVVGSSVRLKIRKPSGKTFECTVQRGSIARIEAMGELFLMLAEVASEIQNNNITKERILG